MGKSPSDKLIIIVIMVIIALFISFEVFEIITIIYEHYLEKSISDEVLTLLPIIKLIFSLALVSVIIMSSRIFEKNNGE